MDSFGLLWSTVWPPSSLSGASVGAGVGDGVATGAGVGVAFSLSSQSAT